MKAYADPKAPLNLEKLRYTTENFHRLRSGLEWIVLGSLFLFERLESIGGLIPWWLEWILCLAWGIFAWYITKYRERRFGWIEPRNPSNKQVVIFFGVFLALYLFRHQAAWMASEIDIRLHLWASDPTRQINLLPIFIWSACFCRASFWPWEKADWNRGCFCAVGITVCGFISFYSHVHPEILKKELWKLLNASLFGVSLIALGLYNYLTLLRLLPKRRGDDFDH
jgi:hypothetical protein